jgi:excisionase family DNA binding protein
MEYLSVADAAARLEVSPRRVRQLLKDGGLAGHRVGKTWLVVADELESRLKSPPSPGRPLSSRSAWDVLAALSEVDEGLEPLAPSARSRARSRAKQLRGHPSSIDPDEWRSALRRRARLHRCYAHPGVIADLLADRRVVRSGISAAQHHGADLVVVGGAEGYVRASDLDGVMNQYALSPVSKADANVWLRVVSEGGDWLFQGRVAPAPVVAADLMERDGYRDHAAGVSLAAAP